MKKKIGKLYNALPLTALFTSIAVAFIADKVFPVAKIIPAPFNIFGIIFVLFAILLFIYGGKMFKFYNTTPKPAGKPSKLITTGVFGFSRNPLYLADLLIVTGAAFLLGSLTAFLAPLLFFAFMNIVIIPCEENRLRDIFGAEYNAYTSSVRRWL